MWLCIRLPQLPLEAVVLASKLSPPGHLNDKVLPAQAVIEDNIVHCLNQAAIEQGVRIGQTVTSAFALCDHLQIIERNMPQERQLLNSLALQVYEISSSVNLQIPIFHKQQKNQDALLNMEIGRSLKLYRGTKNIIQVVVSLLENEGVNFLLGLGDNEKSARLLSYLPIKKSLSFITNGTKKDAENFLKNDVENFPIKERLDNEKISQALCELPVDWLDIDDKTIEKVHSVGLKKIGELNRLAERDISKRFGQHLLRYLMQLFNRISTPINFFKPPETFQKKIFFLEVIHHRQGLIYPIEKLTNNLTQFLRLKQKNCQSIYWELFDSEKNTIGFEVLISESQINTQVYIELTRLNLERYSLHAPIEAIALTANKLNDLASQSKTLFEQVGDFKQDNHFINKIRAKLGSQSCYRLNQQLQHVPELASAYSYELNESKRHALALKTSQTVQELNTSDYTSTALALDINQHPSRPAWLLETPKLIRYNQRKLICNGELQIISSQEKITNYWWKKNIARDYFLAEHEDGTIYWVFYDQIKKQWFLHGVYS